MNGKQAAKLAAKRIEQLEFMNAAAAYDIRQYIECIHSMIEGKSPCSFCEDYKECQLEAKDDKGCTQWWLKFPEKEEEKHEEVPADPADPADPDADPVDGADGGSLDPVSAGILCSLPSESVEEQ